MSPLGTTFRAETQTKPTIPPLLEEERGDDTAEPEDPSTEPLKRVLAGSGEPDVSRVTLAKMPALTGSRGLPPARAWQDWFTIRLRTWANVISPEFETELVKKVLGQLADLSRQGAADRQLAHEVCFNTDDKMLPYLLGADLSSGCAILRVLHREILESTAEHTAALHERFAKLGKVEKRRSCKLSHKGSEAARAANNERDGCKKCGERSRIRRIGQNRVQRLLLRKLC